MQKVEAMAGRGRSLYWGLVIALVVVGLLALLTFGVPVLILAITLAASWPLRRRPMIYWPIVVGVLAMIAGFILAAPWNCVHYDIPGGGGGGSCSNILGVTYSGPDGGNPSFWPVFWPTLLAGLALGLVCAALTFLLLRRQPRVTVKD